MSIWFITYKVMVSSKYMSSSCYRYIHLLRFMSCCCTSIYNKYVNLSGLIFPSSQNSAYLKNNHHKTLLITQISNQFLLWYFQKSFFCYLLNLLPFKNLLLSRSSKQKITLTQSKHLKIGLYRGLANSASY